MHVVVDMIIAAIYYI